MTSRRQPPMVSRMIRQDASALRFARGLSPSLLALAVAVPLLVLAALGGVFTALRRRRFTRPLRTLAA